MKQLVRDAARVVADRERVRREVLVERRPVGGP